jgi:hypothetical protein
VGAILTMTLYVFYITLLHVVIASCNGAVVPLKEKQRADIAKPYMAQIRHLSEDKRRNLNQVRKSIVLLRKLTLDQDVFEYIAIKRVTIASDDEVDTEPYVEGSFQDNVFGWECFPVASWRHGHMDFSEAVYGIFRKYQVSRRGTFERFLRASHIYVCGPVLNGPNLYRGFSMPCF